MEFVGIHRKRRGSEMMPNSLVFQYEANSEKPTLEVPLDSPHKYRLLILRGNWKQDGLDNLSRVLSNHDNPQYKFTFVLPRDLSVSLLLFDDVRQLDLSNDYFLEHELERRIINMVAEHTLPCVCLPDDVDIFVKP